MQALHGFLRSVADAVVESSVGEPAVNGRTHADVEEILQYLRGHLAGVYLPGARIGADERIKKRNKGSGVKVIEDALKVALIVEFKMSVVNTVPLVGSTVLVCLYKRLKVHFTR